MKKKLALLLAIVMVVAMFGTLLAACNNGLTDEQLETLLADVRRYHANDKEITNSNFNVIGRMSNTELDVEANVAWTSSSDKVTISSEMNNAGFYTVTIPDRSTLTEDLSYTLTATLVDEDGNAYQNKSGETYSVSFNRTVTKAGASYAILTMDSTTKATTGTACTDSYGNSGYETITWSENDITLFNEMSTSKSACATYSKPARFYQGSNMEISYVVPIKAIRLIVQSSYEKGLDGVTVDGATIDRVDTTIIIVFNEPTDKFVATLAAQIRIYTVEVYTATAELPELPEAKPDVRYETEEDIIAALKELASGETLTGGTYTLTGVISSIDTEYSSQYGNITVTIKVGTEEYAIQCFRMKGGEGLKVGDKITVTGTLKNYNGTIEFDTGCTYVLADAEAAE